MLSVPPQKRVLFGLTNFLRLFSIVALMLVFVSTILEMVHDTQGYRHYLSSPQANSTLVKRASEPPDVDSDYLRLSRVKRQVVIDNDEVPRSTMTVRVRPPTGIPESEVIETSTHTPTSTSTSLHWITSVTAVSKAVESEPIADTEHTYYPQTNVPAQTGGIVFAVLARVFTALAVILMILSELPPPGPYVEKFFNYVFPPFSQNFGVGVLGGLQIFVGAQSLSHAVMTLTQVSAWMLFIVGFLNLLFGLILRSSIKTTRAILGTHSLSPSNHSEKVGLSTSNEPETFNARPLSLARIAWLQGKARAAAEEEARKNQKNKSDSVRIDMNDQKAPSFQYMGRTEGEGEGTSIFAKFRSNDEKKGGFLLKRQSEVRAPPPVYNS